MRFSVVLAVAAACTSASADLLFPRQLPSTFPVLHKMKNQSLTASQIVRRPASLTPTLAVAQLPTTPVCARTRPLSTVLPVALSARAQALISPTPLPPLRPFVLPLYVSQSYASCSRLVIIILLCIGRHFDWDTANC